jgi:hypothetical protein
VENRSHVPTDTWRLFASHRERLTQEIASSGPHSGGRLCLLGAGRCDDVDLERLSETFSEIHLVDIDRTAVGQALTRQVPAVRARLKVHAPVDFSAFSSRRLRKWQRLSPADSEVDAVAEQSVLDLVKRLPGPFDVVASTCVLTQMSYRLRDAMGRAHPLLGALRFSLIASHLASLTELTASGGRALFVSDLTSSSHVPLADLEPGRDLGELMQEVVASGSTFAGANPHVIRSLVDRDERIESTQWLEPWLWTGALERTYLVYGMRLIRFAHG